MCLFPKVIKSSDQLNTPMNTKHSQTIRLQKNILYVLYILQNNIYNTYRLVLAVFAVYTSICLSEVNIKLY